MAWGPGMKQVIATCKDCGGPGITTKEDLVAGDGKQLRDAIARESEVTAAMVKAAGVNAE